MRNQAIKTVAVSLVMAFMAQSVFGISCQDDTMGGQTARSCVGCITYILQAGSYYRACSPSVPCTDQNTFNYLANRCAQQYQQCQIQCCTTDMCNSATGGVVQQPIVVQPPVIQQPIIQQPAYQPVQPVPAYRPTSGNGQPIVIVSSASHVKPTLVAGAVLATVLAFAARF